MAYVHSTFPVVLWSALVAWCAFGINPDFGRTNATHIVLSGSIVSRRDYMLRNSTQHDDDMLVMFDEIVMAKDEESGIREYVDMLAPRPGFDVLEVGFGMGLSAGLIQDAGCSSHTILEANVNVMRSLVEWKAGSPQSANCIVTPVFGFWEDTMRGLRDDSVDAIMYDPHPSLATVGFLREARRLLRVGGKVVFFISTFYNDTAPEMWRQTQRNLRRAGWQRNEIHAPVLAFGTVRDECFLSRYDGRAMRDCPMRPLTYIVPNITKR